MTKLFITLLFTSTIFCQEYSLNIDNRFANNIKFSRELDDTIVENNKKSLAKPMIASLVVPGLGQLMNKSPWWKTAIFAGIEVAGIAGYFVWTNKADNITDEYERWADGHWDVKRWVSDTQYLSSDIKTNGYPEVNDVIINGSHHIIIVIDGKQQSSDILATNPNIDYIELRDWDFYEGIGKYDQFVAGWDDAKSEWSIVRKNIENGSDELLVMTPNKSHYLNLRNDSNVLYKNAKFAASTLLFNHILSAIEALWSANKNKELSYNLDVSIGNESRYVIKGISVQWNL